MVSIEMLKIRIRLAQGSIKGSNETIRTILKKIKKNGSNPELKRKLKLWRNFNKNSKSILRNARTDLRKLRRKR